MSFVQGWSDSPMSRVSEIKSLIEAGGKYTVDWGCEYDETFYKGVDDAGDQ